MHFGRKILILAVVLLFSYIIYSLLQKRRTIISTIQQYYQEKEKAKAKHLEGFGEKDDPNYDAIMNDIKNISSKITSQIDNNNTPIVYKNYNTNTINNQTKVKDVFIKASYNSAFTGNYLSNEMVKFCLSQGCRFLDFEVDISNNTPMVVCKNSDNTNKTKSGKPEGISLLEVLKCSLDNAFHENSGSMYPITNVNDPLFIHIRCTKEKYENVYTDVLNKLVSDVHYKQYLLWNEPHSKFDYKDLKNARLSDFNKKACIILCSTDNASSSANSKYSNYAYDLKDAKQYSSIISSLPPSQQNNFEIVLSDPTFVNDIKPNPDVFASVNTHKYPITCISYYNYQSGLTPNEKKYENIFTEFNYSFMLMSDLKSYIKNL